MANTTDGLAALKAARLAFEQAGKKSLALSCADWISEVEDEIRSEERQERAEARIQNLSNNDVH